MSRDKLVDVNDPYMHASVNVGYQGKSGPGKIHEVILVLCLETCTLNEVNKRIHSIHS